MVATNAPAELVRVKIKAFSSSWSTLTANDFSATADWGDLAEGQNEVRIAVSTSDPTVTIVSVHPQTVYVRLEPFTKELKEVQVELLDRDQVPLGYRVYSPEIEPSLVSVEGAASAIDRVAKLSVGISLANQRTLIERQLAPTPLDSDGRPVSGVTMTPAQVAVRVSIEKRQNFREVAVRARTEGQAARGYFVSGVDVVPATVTIVGPPSVIENMGGLVDIEGEIDVTGATRMIAGRMALDLPEGVSVLDSQEGEEFTVLVTVGIDAVSGGTTVELPLKAKRIQEGLVAKLSVPMVDVIITGPAVLLDELQTDLVDAYLDLSGLGVGTHQVRPLVDILVEQNPELRDLIVSDVSPKFVEVTIAEPPTMTPTPSATPTSTPTITPSVSLSGTLSIDITSSPTLSGTMSIDVTPGLTGTAVVTGTVVATPTRNQ